MKILITGGLGFIGSHLSELLVKDKHNVILLTKNFSKKSNVVQISNKIKIEKVIHAIPKNSTKSLGTPEKK